MPHLNSSLTKLSQNNLQKRQFQKKLFLGIGGVLVFLSVFSLIIFSFSNNNVQEASAGYNPVAFRFRRTKLPVPAQPVNPISPVIPSNPVAPVNPIPAPAPSPSPVSSKKSYFLLVPVPLYKETVLFVYDPVVKVVTYTIKPGTNCEKITSSNITVQNVRRYSAGGVAFIPDTYVVRINYVSTPDNCGIAKPLYSSSQSLDLNGNALLYLKTGNTKASISAKRTNSSFLLVDYPKQNYLGDFINDAELCSSNSPFLNYTLKCGLPFPE